MGGESQSNSFSPTQFAPGVRLVPGAQLWVPQVTAVAELAPWVLTATFQALLASCHIGFAAKPSCGTTSGGVCNMIMYDCV